MAIGRALVANPSYLLCDEVSLGLSPLAVTDVYALLRKASAGGTAVVLVEQNVNRALSESDRFYCLQKGRVMLEGESPRQTAPKWPRPISECEMAIACETLIDGLLLGALYALFGLGLSISLGVMRMINIAHGDFIVVGAYLTSLTMQMAGVQPLASLIVVVPAMFMLGWLLQRLLLNRVVGASMFAPLLVTFGLSVIIQNLLQETFHRRHTIASGRRYRPARLRSGKHFDRYFAAAFGKRRGSAVCAYAFARGEDAFRPTVARGCRRSGDRTADRRRRQELLCHCHRIRLRGDRDRVGSLRHAHAVLPVVPARKRLLYSFEAVVLGGLGSLWGTLAGGLVIGVAQLFGARISSGLGPFFGHLMSCCCCWRAPTAFSTGRRDE